MHTIYHPAYSQRCTCPQCHTVATMIDGDQIDAHLMRKATNIERPKVGMVMREHARFYPRALQAIRAALNAGPTIGKHAGKEHSELIRHGTDEQAADSIIQALGHVAFMAWLIEVRDQRDARICQQISVHRQLSNSTHELCADVSGLLGPQS